MRSTRMAASASAPMPPSSAEPRQAEKPEAGTSVTPPSWRTCPSTTRRDRWALGWQTKAFDELLADPTSGIASSLESRGRVVRSIAWRITCRNWWLGVGADPTSTVVPAPPPWRLCGHCNACVDVVPAAAPCCRPAATRRGSPVRSVGAAPVAAPAW
jgi:hypothetical protein